MIRMRNPMATFEDAWTQALLPVHNQIVRKSHYVTQYYRVSHEEDGTIKYNPITREEAKAHDSQE